MWRTILSKLIPEILQELVILLKERLKEKKRLENENN